MSAYEALMVLMTIVSPYLFIGALFLIIDRELATKEQEARKEGDTHD